MDYKKLAEEIANGIEAETMKLIDTEFKNLSPEDRRWYKVTQKAEHEAWAVYLETKLKEVYSECETERNNAEDELFAVFYLAVGKWFDDPEAELKKSNRATMAGRAREIALRAIEAETRRADETERKLTEAQATIEKMRIGVTQILEMCTGVRVPTDFTRDPYETIADHAKKIIKEA